MFKGKLVVLIFTLWAGSCYAAPDSRQDPKQIEHQRTGVQGSNETFQCPQTTSEIGHEVDICAKPVMDLLEGRIERWPRTENDILDLCSAFAGSEKCIKDLGRKCTKGLHRTILSTVANSIQRSRKRECTKPKLPNFLKTTQCIEKNNKLVKALISNATDRMYVIENQMTDLDQKTNSLCCMINEIEENFKTSLGVICPGETKVIIRLYRAVLEDVMELICRVPKCKDIFRGYPITKRANSNEGIIQVLLMILFSLG